MNSDHDQSPEATAVFFFLNTLAESQHFQYKVTSSPVLKPQAEQVVENSK